MRLDYTPMEIRERIAERITRRCGCKPDAVPPREAYRAAATVLQEVLADLRHATLEASATGTIRQVHYMSMEYLLGRSLKNHLFNLGLAPVFDKALASLGFDLRELYDMEPDAGLGNGGLGRLAACYMDSLASLAYPAQGYSIRYEFGIFKQRLVDGWQTEQPDVWLDDADMWLTPRPDEAVEVRLGGTVTENWRDGRLHTEHKGYETVLAVPYDMMITGYGGNRVNTLRLWGARGTSGLDMDLFNRGEYLRAMEGEAKAETITKVLYPADDHWEGKALRLKQQYFMVSASAQDILRGHLERHGSLDNLAECHAIHINDTHPALIIPELMRLLMDGHNYAWDRAWGMVTAMASYTNHTIMSEALEVWPIPLFAGILPRIHSIVTEINRRLCDGLKAAFGGDDTRVGRMAVLGTWEVRMANLCLAACRTVNGVSALHSGILRADTFKEHAALNPGKFRNVTNGIAHRRWLNQANPGLAALVGELIGQGYLTNPEELRGLAQYAHGPVAPSVFERLRGIKADNKRRLAEYLRATNGTCVDPDSLFDVQVKRLHEYKRQLLNVLRILYDYERLTADPGLALQPRTFVFGAKASPGYYMAKQMIRLIHHTAAMIDSTPGVRDTMRVVFVEDYNVSRAEVIIPAADISEQISVAGKEASGTGNMKLMLNGAVTVGTLDGANIEMLEAVGPENMLIFGMTVDGVRARYAEGYSPLPIVGADPILASVIDRIRTGINGTAFADVADYLLYGHGGQADPYMCLADFAAYVDIQERADQLYTQPGEWYRMSLMNIAGAGAFAADRSITEYGRGIWGLEPRPIPTDGLPERGLAAG